LGRAAVETLAARGERVVAFASRPRTLTLAGGDDVAVAALDALRDTPHDVLLHFAYLTREHAATHGHDAYVAGNLAISATVVEAIARQRPQAVAYASSGAVYAAASASGLAFDVAENPYGALKRLDELTLRQAAADAGAAAVVARVFNVAGPWITKPRGFALSDLAWRARAGEPLRLQARHPVQRSYVDVEDLAALLVALCDARRDARFDTAGDEVVEVGALAERVRAVLGREDLPIERDWDPSAPADRYVGDGTALRALAAEHGVALRGLDEQIARTAAGLPADGAPA
jgi:UDP-glucuronate decarboxylase